MDDSVALAWRGSDATGPEGPLRHVRGVAHELACRGSDAMGPEGSLRHAQGVVHELGWRGSDAKGPEGLLRHAQGVSSSQASTGCTYVGLRTLWHSEGAASCLLVPSPGRVLTEPCPRPRVRALGVCKWVLCWYRSKRLITAKLPGAHMIAGGSQLCPFSCRHPRLSLLADTGAYQDYKDPGPLPQLEAFGRASRPPPPTCGMASVGDPPQGTCPHSSSSGPACGGSEMEHLPSPTICCQDRAETGCAQDGRYLRV